MKLIISIVLTILISVLLFVGESKAIDCGMGVTEKIIFRDYTLSWFNGGPRLDSPEGLGVVYRGLRLQSENESVFEVNRITKYKVGEDFIQLVINGVDGRIQTLEIRPPLFEPQLYYEYEIRSEWVEVSPVNCFFGRWDFLRLLMLITLLAISVYAIKSRSKGKLSQ
jgi:hypothetical protein